MNYLNTNECNDRFNSFFKEDYFVDKTLFINEISKLIGKENKYICITRPRRFGKTAAAIMLSSFFGKHNSKKLFSSLNIAKTDCYKEHLNKHNVIFIDFSKEVGICDNFENYIKKIINKLTLDLNEQFEKVLSRYNIQLTDLTDLLNYIYSQTGEKFIFIFDEWDAPFRFKFMKEKDKQSYIDFLHVLLKGQPYVELSYMTGILPIKKYSSTSDLNMFADYTLFQNYNYTTYFGFTDTEVDELYKKLQQRETPRYTREELGYWYDGYITADGEHIYNPRSVILAIKDNQIKSYWTESGPSDEIFELLKLDVDEVQKPVAKMLNGESVDMLIDEYSVTKDNIDCKEDIFSYFIVYGLLTSDDKNSIRIPNYEIKDKFNREVRTKKGLGYIARLAKNSLEILRATKEGDEEAVRDYIEKAHDSESTILTYNRESELSAIVNLVYLAARDYYYVEREAKTGKGFADMIYTPFKKSDDIIILEFKVNDTAENAIEQIKQKHYTDRFTNDPSYTGRMLLVGIGYDKESKKHDVKIIEKTE